MKTDIRPVSVDLYFIPIETRVPLKFGPETLTSVICARACVTVANDQGQTAQGWGETPLSVQWVWPGPMAYETRLKRLEGFCCRLALAWADFDSAGHPMELGWDFLEQVLPALNNELNAECGQKADSMPHLAALVCSSPFDLALHDAYGALHGISPYETYSADFMSRDLADFLAPAEGSEVSFAERYPADYLVSNPPKKLVAWHLVAGLDLLDDAERTGAEPDDGYPVVLADWIRRDGLKCLKVKLRGNDADRDYERMVNVGRIAIDNGALWLSADFNCTVQDPDYVNGVLDRLRDDAPRVYGMILYVEQPFPYDLESNRIDVHSVSARKPLFMDESAHDWRLVSLGRSLGWSGVALKTCKTQTGAILSMCWARAHGMPLMVQDLANPMLAQPPHLLLAARAGTIMGVETNSMQFYPAASEPEARVHPGMFRRRDGCVDLSTLGTTGFGCRVDEIDRRLPEPAMVGGSE